VATLIAAAAWTILLSVLAHGLSAIPLSAWYALYHISRPHDALLDAIDAAGGTVYRGVADNEATPTEPGLVVLDLHLGVLCVLCG